MAVERQYIKIRSLPAPPKQYDQREQAEFRRAVELAFVEVSPTADMAQFEFLYEFGIGGTSPTVGEQRVRMLPRDCTFLKWFVRGDTVGSATFNFSFANGINGAINPVGGTQPFVSAAFGHGLDPVDWTTTGGTQGDCLICELTGVTTFDYVAVSVICQG